jgi:hypothetical protein
MILNSQVYSMIRKTTTVEPDVKVKHTMLLLLNN